MSLLALAATAILAPMLGVALWNLAKAYRLERAPVPDGELPAVSLLVPARDEAENLARLLPALRGLEYTRLEVLVLDDGSADDTAARVRRAERESGGRVRLLAGAPLPAGWVGKCWACHQLAAAATGEVLVFCDADVTPRPDALLRTVGALRREGVDALTALPRQRLEGAAQRAVVPLVAQLPVLALLPLPLVPRVRAPSLSMANGQWLALTRAAYAACGGHAAVRGEVVEDVALGRRIKAAGHRLLPAVSTRALEVRMYRDGAALREGFAKNLYPLLGGTPPAFAAGLAVLLLAGVYPWAGVLLGAPGALLPLGLLAALRVCGALLFRHGWGTVLLHPVGSLLAAALAVESAARAWRGTARWKGRTLGGAA